MNKKLIKQIEDKKKKKIIISLVISILILSSIFGITLYRTNSNQKYQEQLKSEFNNSLKDVDQLRDTVYSYAIENNVKTYTSTKYNTLRKELDKIANSEYDGKTQGSENEVSKVKTEAKELNTITEQYFQYINQKNAQNIQNDAQKYEEYAALEEKLTNKINDYGVASKQYLSK